MSPTFRALSNHNYRLYLAGSVVSNTGTWMQRIAQDWLVLSLPGTGGTELGITTGLQFLPVLLLAPYAGVVADRFPKRLLLQLTQLGMALSAIALGVIAVTGHAEVWMVYAPRVHLRHRLGLRRPDPPVVRLRDGRTRRPDQRGRAQLRGVQHRPAGRPRRWPAS